MLEFDDGGRGEVGLELEDVGHVGTAPPVDGLVVVAYDRHVRAHSRKLRGSRMRLGEERDEVELETVRVLKFVHHEVAEPAVPAFLDGQVIVEEFYGEEKQVVEIDRVERFEFGVVAQEDGTEQGLVILRFAPAVVLRFADGVFRGVRVEFFVLGCRASDDLFDETHLVALVVNREVLFVAEGFDVLPQDAHAKGVEGGHGDFFCLLFRDERGKALAHFGRGFVGKCDGQYTVGRDALAEHVGGAHRDDARLSAARSGKDEQRTLGGAHREFLLWI